MSWPAIGSRQTIKTTTVTEAPTGLLHGVSYAMRASSRLLDNPAVVGRATNHGVCLVDESCDTRFPLFVGGQRCRHFAFELLVRSDACIQ